MTGKKRLLTTEDVANILGVTPQTVANWRQSGRHSLPHFKIDRLVRYDPDDVEDFLANSEVTESQENYEFDDDEDDSDDDFDDDDTDEDDD